MSVNTRAAVYALMFGNLITGVTVLIPAGLMPALSEGLAVSPRDIGLLIAWGGVVLCVGSPLMAWIASSADRRWLLTGSLAAMTAGAAVSAFAPSYDVLLAMRLATLAIAVIFTPVAAATIAMIVTEAERAKSISFIFLGWSLALAGGLPLIALLGERIGWRATYGAVAALSLAACVCVAASIPRGLRAPAMSLASWGVILRNGRVLLLLSVTILWSGGFYVTFPYVAPLVGALLGQGSDTAALLFLIQGIMGFIGNVVATRAVDPFGAYRTGIATAAAMFVGALCWAFAANSVWLMVAGSFCWGLGTASTNSMIQARLVSLVPAVASAAVALNTSWLYVGQAGGSWIGGELLAVDRFAWMGPASAILMGAALILMIASRERHS
jgi:DHA1 family inner membrane transport protein